MADGLTKVLTQSHWKILFQNILNLILSHGDFNKYKSSNHFDYLMIIINETF